MSFPLDYFGQAAYPPDLNPPIVDHLHTRHQPHPSLLQYLAHRNPYLKPAINQPDLDLRDTESEYVIEVELPGITDKNAIKIEWTSSRSLSIIGNIDRPVIPDNTSSTATLEKMTKSSTGTRGADGEWIPPSDAQPQRQMLMVAERKIGPFQRHFNFPVDVDVENLKAKLEAGLLTIRVPKKVLNVRGGRRVTIE
jgi:HSP20 family molecular chaperone IbpA